MATSRHYCRPEYPRPDFRRGFVEGSDWLNLNGPWQFRFDGRRCGIDEEWFKPEQRDWNEQILVPFCWESLAAWGDGDAASNDNFYSTRVFHNPLEVTRENHRSAPRYEVGWYRRRIEIPAHPSWQGKQAILKIGAADFFTDCWCNAIHLGRHEGGYTPFEYDLTDSLTLSPEGIRYGYVTLRVEDPMDNQEQPVGKQWRWYTTTSGIWQTVYLEPRSRSYIKHFRITPFIERSLAHFEIFCPETPHGMVELGVEFPSGGFRKAELLVENGVAKGDIDVSPLQLWDPNEPNLYQVLLSLKKEGQTEDQVQSYFGMRKIEAAIHTPAAPASLHLNGKAIYLRGALYQSYFPEGVYTAGDSETLRHDIAFAKKAGFDFLRIHIKIDDPLLLYYADTLGILLMEDFPNFGEGGDTPLGRSRFETMMREAITRDFNHPSIVAWCLFNETWGFGGQVELVKLFPHLKHLQPDSEKRGQLIKLANQESQAWVHGTWQLAKSLDPTRLIEDMSVVHWEHLEYFGHSETDINSWHFYINDYQKAKDHIAKVVADTFSGSSFNYVSGYTQKNQPLMNSEYGGVGALDGDRDISWSFKFLTNELRLHPSLCAYIFTQLHDVEWEFNGFLNYDRTRKHFGFDPSIINGGDVLPIESPPIFRVKYGEEIKIPVYSSHFCRKKRENVFLEWRVSGIDAVGKLKLDLTRGREKIPFEHRQVQLAKEISFRAPSEFMACRLEVKAVNAMGEEVACNFVEFLASDGPRQAREENARGIILRARPCEFSEAHWQGSYSPRNQAAEEDSCFGHGHGFFEWALPIETAQLQQARRLRLVCEASSCRTDTPQTSDDAYPSTLKIYLNDLRVHETVIPDHPFDARGSLSYLRGARGAYGYLAHSTIEGDLLQEILRQGAEGFLRLKCEVPADARPQGGLTLYGCECGRFPLAPTVVLEW